jgi:hypothetical protein
LALFFYGADAMAQSNAIASGNWSDPLTWNPSEPVAGTEANINGGFAVTVDQAGEVANILDVSDAAAQTGSLSVAAPGTLTLGTLMRVGFTANTTGNVNMSGGTVTVNGAFDSGIGNGELIVGDAGGNGTFSMSGGTVTTADEIFIGLGAGSVGDVNVSGGSFSSLGRSILVGFAGGNGSLDVTGTGDVNANFDMLVGFLPGSIASVTLADSGTIDAGFLFTNFAAGPGGSTVTMTQTGGTYTARIAYVLGQGPGTTNMTHSGGTINVTIGNGDMVVSDGGGNTSTYDISGTANVVLSNQLIVAAFHGSNGTVNQSGGTINAGGNIDVGRDGVGAYNLSGGTVNAANVFLGDFDTSLGTMKISGGTLNLTGNYNVGAALASNADPDGARAGTQGQAAQANGVLIVSGSSGDINIAGDFLANPADKTRPPADANSATLVFELFGDSGTSLIDVSSAADLDGAQIDLDLMGGYTPTLHQSFVLLTASAGIGGDTGTGTTKSNGSNGEAFTLSAEDATNWTLAVQSNGGLSESLVAIYVPEPTALTMLTVGGVITVLCRGCRRSRSN